MIPDDDGAVTMIDGDKLHVGKLRRCNSISTSKDGVEVSHLDNGERRHRDNIDHVEGGRHDAVKLRRGAHAVKATTTKRRELVKERVFSKTREAKNKHHARRNKIHRC